MNKFMRGDITLSLLIILSSALFLFLLMNDKRLSLYSFLSAERQLYVSNSLELQNLSQEKRRSVCSSLEIEPDKSVNIVEIDLPNTLSHDGLKNYFYCQHLSLFKIKPSKKSHEKGFSDYISMENAQKYTFSSNKTLLPISQPKLYWFSEPQVELEIKGKVEGIIIAEGNLTLKAEKKSNFRGSIITGGSIDLQNVTTTYDKNVVLAIFQQYTQWQPVAKSWSDFNVENIKNN